MIELLAQDRESKTRHVLVTIGDGAMDTCPFMRAPANFSALRFQPLTLAIAARSVRDRTRTVFGISNDLSGKNRENVAPGHQRGMKCPDGLDRLERYRLSPHHIAG